MTESAHPYLDRAGQGLTNVAVVFLGAILIGSVAVPLQGGNQCRRDARAEIGDGTVLRTTWARSYADHWAAGVVVQPRDIGADPFTVVCHFAADNYARGRIEVAPGDRLDAFRAVTRTNLNPLTWLP